MVLSEEHMECLEKIYGYQQEIDEIEKTIFNICNEIYEAKDDVDPDVYKRHPDILRLKREIYVLECAIEELQDYMSHLTYSMTHQEVDEYGEFDVSSC